MSVSEETLRLMAQLRVLLTGQVDTVEADLVRQWAVAWDEIVDEWRQAVADLADTSLTAAKRRQLVLRSERIRKALQTTAAKLDELVKAASGRITLDLPSVLSQGDRLLSEVVASQLPAQINPAMSRISQGALDAIVKRTTGQIESRLAPLPREAVAVMRAELIRGVAVGSNPNTVASHLLRRAQGAFDGGLRRARTIARTEMLDAHRAGALVARQRDADVLAGWRWTCSLSGRTCPSCLAMNGQLFPIDESGPDDHPCGRCTSTPVTKSWKELGIDIDEPADQFPDARGWFAQQPEQTQLDIMGSKRLDALNSGRLQWDDIPMKRANPGWRDSYQVAPVR